MDRHTPKGSVPPGHGVPCRALPLIKTKKKKKKRMDVSFENLVLDQLIILS